MPRLPKDPEARAYALADLALDGFVTAEKQLEEANEALKTASLEAAQRRQELLTAVRAEEGRALFVRDSIDRNTRVIGRLRELTA